MTSPVSLGQALVAPELRPPNLGGAGHFLDVTFPTRQMNAMDQNPGANNNDSFIRGTLGSVAGVRVGLGGGTSDTLVLAAGSIPCLAMNSTAAAGTVAALIGAVWHGAFLPPTGAAAASMRVPTPWAVCRMIMRMATEAPVPGANRDLGFCFAQPTAGTNAPYGLFNTAGATGFALNGNSNGKWSLDVKAANGGAVTRNELSSLSRTVFQTFEFRVFEATQTNAAFYQFFVNGVEATALIPVTCRNFGVAGTLLPQNDINTARYSGMVPSLVSNAGIAGSALYVQYLRVILADTLAAALT